VTAATGAIHVRRPAIALRAGSGAAVLLAGLVGLAAFLWPFVVVPGSVGDSTTAPFIFAALLLLVVVVVLSEISRGGIDSKAVAMLGVLSALGAALRPLGAGTAGIETVFFTLVIAGRVYGAGFGFCLGCTTLAASALVTGGVGPWLPYQMFASAWVGLLAGLLPPLRGRAELLVLAAYGAAAGYMYGLLINLSTWAFSADPHSSIAYLPGAAVATNIHRYLAYWTATSLGWDTGRAVTNVVCILVLGPAMLSTFRRAARRAAFAAPARFGGVPEGESAGSVQSGGHPAQPDQGPGVLDLAHVAQPVLVDPALDAIEAGDAGVAGHAGTEGGGQPGR
jgi:energy-coupling factor transport system substrate-specific component